MPPNLGFVSSKESSGYTPSWIWITQPFPRTKKYYYARRTRVDQSEIEKDDMKRTYEELRQAAGKELFSSSFALSQPTLRIDFNHGLRTHEG